ncbi:MAG: pirin family protein [Gammaproteobacteria bacterium]|nr:pirin family protein [Gammaproteobacteria bacterium]
MEGDGAEVRRLFPIPRFMNFDPFVLWDHFDIGAGAGFPEHPHRGFEAITYVFEGGMQHADNLGNTSTVGPLGVQRFTAGRGIVHSEMPAATGHTRGIQLWINLPQRLKHIDPEYQQVDAQAFPEERLPHGRLRTLMGPGSPLRLHTPIRYYDLHLDSGGSHTLPMQPGEHGLAYVVSGNARINGTELEAGMAWFGQAAAPLEIHADTAARLMLVFGTPHGEPIYQHGPYVD